MRQYGYWGASVVEMDTRVTGFPSPTLAVTENTENWIIRTENLSKRFGNRLVLDEVNLEVRRGDVFGLLGPNGSGKTTTLRLLLNLIWPTAGSIYLFGNNVSAGNTYHSALLRIGALVEQPAFYPYLKGFENLHGCAMFAGLPDNATTRDRIQEVLALVGLAGYPGPYRTYSLGMKQRLGIAATLLTRPALVILDEPMNGLDPAGMVDVRALIGQLAESGTTVVLSSHLLYEVQQVCTRVAILKEGRLLTQGTVSDLLASSTGVLLSFAEAEQLPLAAGILLQAVSTEGDWLRGAHYVLPEPGSWTPPGGWCLLADAPADRAAQVNALLGAHGIYPAELRRFEGNLEQVFLRLTGNQSQSQSQTIVPQVPA
ncbi:MAG: ABC transporter ATP-binding protein [Ktedonobacterales bacterium]